MVKITGYDCNGVPRVYAEDTYFQTAVGFCKEEAREYVKKRPDTGPLSDWRLCDDHGDEYESCLFGCHTQTLRATRC
jgi:hypothetical protein